MVCPLMVVINLISSMDSMQYLRINDSENIYRKKKKKVTILIQLESQYGLQQMMIIA